MNTYSLLILHFCSCFAMTGLIWLVQLVHYPSFLYIDKNQFKKFENFHARSITFIVFPLMLCELVTAFFLTIDPLYKMINIIGVITLWLLTLIISMPRHHKLSRDGYDPNIIRSLVLTNWPRTIIWSLRSLLFIYILMSQNII